MKILYRYILKEFVKVFSITALAMSALFLVIEVIEKIDELVEWEVGFYDGLRYFVYKIPFIMTQTLPMGMLLSTLLTIGILNRHKEIAAIKAGGIGIARVLLPLFALGIFISFFVFTLNEYVTPRLSGFVESVEAKKYKEKPFRFFGREGLWFRENNAFHNVRKVDLERKTIEGVNVYQLERSGVLRLKTRISARDALWEDGKWVGKKVIVWRFSDKGAVTQTIEKDFVFEGIGSPEELLGAEKGYKKMGFFELASYIEGLEDDGYDTKKYKLELYAKMSLPLVNLVMVLIAIPFALRTGRGAGIASGMGMAVIIGFSWWVVTGISNSLGQTGAVPAIVAAFFPDILFIGIGIIMFGSVRQ